jgi:hypothetical protein
LGGWWVSFCVGGTKSQLVVCRDDIDDGMMSVDVFVGLGGPGTLAFCKLQPCREQGGGAGVDIREWPGRDVSDRVREQV